jgi:hypothetical protein
MERIDLAGTALARSPCRATNDLNPARPHLALHVAGSGQAVRISGTSTAPLLQENTVHEVHDAHRFHRG